MATFYLLAQKFSEHQIIRTLKTEITCSLQPNRLETAGKLLKKCNSLTRKPEQNCPPFPNLKKLALMGSVEKTQKKDNQKMPSAPKISIGVKGNP